MHLETQDGPHVMRVNYDTEFQSAHVTGWTLQRPQRNNYSKPLSQGRPIDRAGKGVPEGKAFSKVNTPQMHLNAFKKCLWQMEHQSKEGEKNKISSCGEKENGTLKARHPLQCCDPA